MKKTISSPVPQGHQPLIHLNKVSKTFRNAAGVFYALREVSLTVNAGEFVGILGKSGSGKSTLINMMCGIDRPTSGEVHVNGAAMHTMNENCMARWRGTGIGLIFQFFQLLPTLSVVENVVLPMDFCDVYAQHERRAKAMALLDLLEMSSHANKLPSALSGGQQQRVAIARALANDPPILVADEPTGNLDSQTAQAVMAIFEQLSAQGKTILVVTHDNELASHMPRQIVIHDGAIAHDSSADTHLDTYSDTFSKPALKRLHPEATSVTYTPNHHVYIPSIPASAAL